MSLYARITGTGGYLPPKIVTNADLSKKMDTSDEWIKMRTGIKERRQVENESACDLAENAAKLALDMAGIKAKELDLIIVATTTPDKIFPATAILLQDRLNAHCPAFDMQAVCAGFIYALTTADAYIKTNKMHHILIVGSEILSRITHPTDRNTAVLFGDGAGALVLSADKNTGLLYSELHSDGRYSRALYVNNDTGFIEMDGNEVFKVAVTKLSALALITLKSIQMSTNDLDWMIPHQANIRIIKAVAKRIKLPMEKVVVTLDKHANTSAASIPLALDVAVRDGRIQKNHSCLFEAMGAGFSWGSALLRF